MSLILFSGEKQTGKSTFLYNKFSLNKNVGGIVCLERNNQRQIVDLQFNQFYIHEVHFSSVEECETIGRFTFLKRSFLIGATIINDSTLKNKLTIIDEWGLLEESNKGLMPHISDAVVQTSKSINTHILLVIRPSLVEMFRSKYISEHNIILPVFGRENVGSFLDPLMY